MNVWIMSAWVCFAAMAPVQLSAQVTTEVGVGPDAFGFSSERKEPKSSSPLALAMSLILEDTPWTEIGISTNSASEFFAQWLRRGFYRLELLQLTLMARQSKSRLPELILRREKGESLKAIAQSLSIPFEQLYENALELSRKVEERMEGLYRVSTMHPQRTKDP